MKDEEFDIKPEDTFRLLADLMIKNIAETQSLKELIFLNLAAEAPIQNRDKILQDLHKGAPIRTRELYEHLRDEIWKQYGHFDLEGL